VAAREIQEKGRLVYHPLQEQQQQQQDAQLGPGTCQDLAQGTEGRSQHADADGSSSINTSNSSRHGDSVSPDMTCVAVLSEDADRDRCSGSGGVAQSQAGKAGQQPADCVLPDAERFLPDAVLLLPCTAFFDHCKAGQMLRQWPGQPAEINRMSVI